MSTLPKKNGEMGLFAANVDMTNYCKGKKPFSRRCTKCKTEESATAHTIFHKCKFPLTEAFKITYIVCHNPEISIYKLSENINLQANDLLEIQKENC